ncbi:ammonia-dependent NAD(+) synthetase [Aestuariimicrobium ganziense]|uniref:ammonia-dependent NAD(+) synthetase n=1 Tax=Aestuariimicrobium ganziense TaxID=2773677 RepID=UPI001940451A|nr:ammonia-dependent NAD(+) synthetase [Aestuariimicrobium ganziense]
MTDTALQQEIATELQVVQNFDPTIEAERRINFLADYLRTTGMKGYVLGISGGVDSSLGGRLAQMACERLRNEGYDATFVAMRLPYHEQADEADAQAALEFVAADEVATVDIGPATDALWDATAGTDSADEAVMNEFGRGNVKARQRMVAQYTLAAARSMLVIGTDQAAEAVVGFYTKYGDGACDLTPLAGLTKRMVRATARHLGAPDAIVEKVPTADLESDRPLRADEEALGVSYDHVDDYLEGLEVPEEAERTILQHYFKTIHKRAMPVTPLDFETRQRGGA